MTVKMLMHPGRPDAEPAIGMTDDFRFVYFPNGLDKAPCKKCWERPVDGLTVWALNEVATTPIHNDLFGKRPSGHIHKPPNDESVWGFVPDG
jgi:hypothetical protein